MDFGELNSSRSHGASAGNLKPGNPNTLQSETMNQESLPLCFPKEERQHRKEATACDREWLQQKVWPETSGPEVRCVDLFSGCGGLTLAAWEATRMRGKQLRPLAALDIDQTALHVYRQNFRNADIIGDNLSSFVSDDLDAPLRDSERELQKRVGSVDLLVAGPPCQGHSDLNNHSRRNDPKNVLVRAVLRAVIVLRPTAVLIENVQGIRRDRGGHIGFVKNILLHHGYEIDEGLVMASDVGVPQKRRRYFLIGSSKKQPSIARAVSRFNKEPTTVSWAIDDLSDLYGHDVFNTSAKPSDENQKRIDKLFSLNVYELPNEYRPDCHKLKKHSYNSVYGRMYWNGPSPTITTGFGSTGQGRFVHPQAPRTITPHEAARLQTFPDFFDFSGVGRSKLQTLIGNAVPPLMGVPLIDELLTKLGK